VRGCNCKGNTLLFCQLIDNNKQRQRESAAAAATATTTEGILTVNESTPLPGALLRFEISVAFGFQFSAWRSPFTVHQFSLIGTLGLASSQVGTTRSLSLPLPWWVVVLASAAWAPRLRNGTCLGI